MITGELFGGGLSRESETQPPWLRSQAVLAGHAFRLGERACAGRGRRLAPGAGRAYRGADLAVLGGHAVSVVQVCEGLGRPPGLQVPGHADRSPHLRSVKRVSRSEEVLRAPPLSLGARNAASHLEARRRAAALQPSQSLPRASGFLCQHRLHPAGSCRRSCRVAATPQRSRVSLFQTTKPTCAWNFGKNNSHWKGRFHNADS